LIIYLMRKSGRLCGSPNSSFKKTFINIISDQ
jgi:hypothetical protein